MMKIHKSTNSGRGATGCSTPRKRKFTNQPGTQTKYTKYVPRSVYSSGQLMLIFLCLSLHLVAAVNPRPNVVVLTSTNNAGHQTKASMEKHLEKLAAEVNDKEADIVLLGFQELSITKARYSANEGLGGLRNTKDTDTSLKIVQGILEDKLSKYNATYNLLDAKGLTGIGSKATSIIILTKKDTTMKVTVVNKGSSKRGLGGLAANKGYVYVKLEVKFKDGRSALIGGLCCHNSVNSYEQTKEDFEECAKKANKLLDDGCSIVFMFGDFNPRLPIGPQCKTTIRKCTEIFATHVNKILYDFDEKNGPELVTDLEAAQSEWNTKYLPQANEESYDPENDTHPFIGKDTKEIKKLKLEYQALKHVKTCLQNNDIYGMDSFRTIAGNEWTEPDWGTEENPEVPRPTYGMKPHKDRTAYNSSPSLENQPWTDTNHGGDYRVIARTDRIVYKAKDSVTVDKTNYYTCPEMNESDHTSAWLKCVVHFDNNSLSLTEPTTMPRLRETESAPSPSRPRPRLVIKRTVSEVTGRTKVSMHLPHRSDVPRQINLHSVDKSMKEIRLASGALVPKTEDMTPVDELIR